MNRDIKFRGRRIDNGEWITGYLLGTQMSGVYIIGTKMKSKPTRQGIGLKDVVWQYEVDPATVGQFVGLEDKNGREIYEGDIVIARYEGEKDEIYQVQYRGDHDYPAFDLVPYVDCECNAMSYYSQAPESSMEIIGNIHDNPELLAGKEADQS